MVRRDQHLETFREEAAEHLDELEAALLELETNPESSTIVDRAFRALHTLKGTGAMFGFDSLANLAHELESLFDLVRGGSLSANTELIDLTLRGKDVIRSLLDTDDAEGLSPVLAELRAFAEHAAELPAPELAPTPTRVFGVHFTPDQDLLRGGSNPLVLLEELAELGDLFVRADAAAVPDLETIEPEACYLEWWALVRGPCDADTIRDVFVFVEHRAGVAVEELEEVPGPSSPWHPLCQQLLDEGALSADELSSWFLTSTVEEILAENDGDEGPIDEHEQRQAIAELLSSSIRVPVERLDKLVNLVGELVIAQARLFDLAYQRDDAEVLNLAEVLERLTSELRDNTLSIRTLAIGTTFGRFRRLVRDLALELDKDVHLVTSGADTELDKTVIERMMDPLVHVLRNAVSHGIESPQERAAAGKPREGVIRLKAEHREAHVVLTIEDDGAGLDREAILRRAIERELVAPDAQLDGHQIAQLIFEPGFSTVEEISDVSGRGVGMDVVRRSIEALRGSIDIDTTPGRGTKLTIKLPLTLAIIEGLQVAVGKRRYVFPLAAVEECFDFSEARESHAMVQIREELIPFVRLREWFDVEGEPEEHEQLVVVRVGERSFGFVVDWVIGQTQAVMKSLGQVYAQVDGLSGATILGDGSVALIVDLGEIAEVVLARNASAVHGNRSETSATRTGAM